MSKANFAPLRFREAECHGQFGLALAQQGEREQALSHLRAALAYEEEIDYPKAAKHRALIARLEVGEELPSELLPRMRERAIGQDADRAGNDQGV